ncbi:MAG: hypothetical protein V4645_09945 [Pseudomonadota bacterium]
MDLDKVEQRVNEVINSAMSKAFEKRDSVVRELERARQEASDLGSRLSAARDKIGDVERESTAQMKSVKTSVSQLEADAQSVIRLLAKHTGAAEQLGQLVGNLVRIKGGSQSMVAAGLVEDGGIQCLYERATGIGTEIVSIEIPAAALELVSQPAAKRAAKRQGGRA